MQRGLTLIEVLVSVAIFSILSTIVIFNYGTFNSNLLVTNLAYEIALAARQAQVYGLSVKTIADQADNTYAYGLSFNINETTGNNKFFYIYADYGERNGVMDGDMADCGEPGEECQERFEIRGDVEITKLCVTDGTEDCEIDKLNVIFLRPNPVAIIFAENDPPDELYVESPFTFDVQSATITIKGTRSEKEKVIYIDKTGQISVQDI